MSVAETPKKADYADAVPGDGNKHEPDPATELEIEANPQPEPDSSLPPVEDDPKIQETEQQPT